MHAELVIKIEEQVLAARFRFFQAVAGELLRMVYADPHLYELLVAVEPGYGLLDLVEGMALEMNLEEVEPALALMRELCREPQA